MPPSIVLLLVGLLTPGLSLPFPSGLQDTGGTHYPPAVYVLPPPSEKIVLRETDTLTYLIKGFHPSEFFMKWLRNDEPVADSEYVTSKPFVPPAYKKDELVAPEVHLLHSSRKPRDSNDTVMLTCSITNFYPEDESITWMENGEPEPLSPNTEHHWKDANKQTFITTSTLNVPFNDWMRSGIFSCQVTHKPTSTNMKSQARKRRGDSNPDVKVYTQRPNPEDMNLEKAAKFTCVMSKEKLAVSWSQKNPGTLTPKAREVQTEFNSTISQVTASITDGKAGETFTCKVEHAQGLTGAEGEKTGIGGYLY